MIVTCARDQARMHMCVEIPIDCYDFRMHLIGLFYQLHTSHMIPNELGVHIAFFFFSFTRFSEPRNYAQNR